MLSPPPCRTTPQEPLGSWGFLICGLNNNRYFVEFVTHNLVLQRRRASKSGLQRLDGANGEDRGKAQPVRVCGIGSRRAVLADVTHDRVAMELISSWDGLQM